MGPNWSTPDIQFNFARTKRKSPAFLLGFSRCNSLTMSYFHTGTRTIIGAEAFHCPVRDGKEWDHLAMVIRHNLLMIWPQGQINEFIEFSSAPFARIYILNASLGITIP